MQGRLPVRRSREDGGFTHVVQVHRLRHLREGLPDGDPGSR